MCRFPPSLSSSTTTSRSTSGTSRNESSRSTSASTDSSRNTSGTSNDSTDIDQREGANYIYSAMKKNHRVRLEMDDGSWHYLVHVDRFGAQIRVEIEDKDGVRKVDGVLYNIGPDDLVKLFPEMSDKPEWVDDDHWSEFSWHEL